MSHLRQVDIPDAATIANEETVHVLEQMLDLARNGHLVGVMICGELSDGNVVTTWTDGLDFRQRIARLEILKLDWYTKLNQAAEGDDG